MKTQKVYRVEFMEYTNNMRDTVSANGLYIPKDGLAYLKLGDEPFLATEDQLPYLKHFGEGFRSLRFVGYMGTFDNTSSELNTSEPIVAYYTTKDVTDNDLHYTFTSDPEGELDVDNGETNR